MVSKLSRATVEKEEMSTKVKQWKHKHQELEKSTSDLKKGHKLRMDDLKESRLSFINEMKGALAEFRQALVDNSPSVSRSPARKQLLFPTGEELAEVRSTIEELKSTFQQTSEEISSLESYIKNLENSLAELRKYLSTLHQFQTELSCRNCGALFVNP
eukprot:TRINITY_DN1072_c0_g1_i1.p1 TRINITY_DN1072_c0_g1~~TRINITY_DN1072_c0_g1_i1.p1  ORF type:complete len:158 (-),score=24.11 TRINITY_DN1072_c0_g1_i1:40-513(-)